MSSFTAMAMSSFVTVTDIAAFTAEVTRLSLDVVTANGQVAVEDPTGEGFAFTYETVVDGETVEVDVNPVTDWGKYLADGQVMILMQSGMWQGGPGENAPTGWAQAFNNRGESHYLHLNDIYRAADTLGRHTEVAL